jgi:mannose-1-phosphate guanylyltransferase
MKGFILAAGEGTRLLPKTLHTPKPLLSVGEIPIINYLVDLFLRCGVNDIKIGVQHKHLKEFQRWQATYYPEQKIDLVAEGRAYGTFTPINNLSPEWFNEPIVVSNGDELKDIDLDKMIKRHLKQNSIATVGLIKVDNPCAYGVAILKGNKIVTFVEKPKVAISPYINSGIYVFNPEIRNYYPEGAKHAMVETDLLPKLAEKGILCGYKLSGRWMDTGTHDRLEEANKNWNNKGSK